MSIFPVLLKLSNEDRIILCELLDAIGYMTFYHKELAAEGNCNYILSA